MKRVDGHLTQWNDARGFGFLTPLRSHEQTFVHISAFPRGAGRPRLGQVYSFAIEVAPGGKRQAVQLQPEGRGRPATANRAAPGRTAAGRRPATRARSGAAGYLAIVAFVAGVAIINLTWPVPLWLGAVYVAASLVCAMAYAIDKRAAVTGRWRVSENTLLLLGFLGGWPGAIIAQQALRHKTRKVSFRRAFWGTVVLNVFAVAVFATPLFSRFLADTSGS